MLYIRIVRIVWTILLINQVFLVIDHYAKEGNIYQRLFRVAFSSLPIHKIMAWK